MGSSAPAAVWSAEADSVPDFAALDPPSPYCSDFGRAASLGLSIGPEWLGFGLLNWVTRESSRPEASTPVSPSAPTGTVARPGSSVVESYPDSLDLGSDFGLKEPEWWGWPDWDWSFAATALVRTKLIPPLRGSQLRFVVCVSRYFSFGTDELRESANHATLAAAD